MDHQPTGLVAIAALLLALGCPLDRLDEAYHELWTKPVPETMDEITAQVKQAIEEVVG